MESASQRCRVEWSQRRLEILRSRLLSPRPRILMVGPSSSSLAAKAKDFMPVRSLGVLLISKYTVHISSHLQLICIYNSGGNYPSQWSEVFRMAHVWEEFFNVASADAQAMVEAQRSSSGLEKEKMHSMAYDSRTPQTSDS